MNRRSFFGLFGGAAAVPFLPLPEPVTPFIEAIKADDEFMHVQYGLTITQTDDMVTGGPKLLWPGIKAIYGDDLYAKMYGDDA